MSTTTVTGLEQLTGTYDIDASHSTLGFATKHAMVTTVRGRFGDFAGTLYLDGAAPERSRAEVTIQAASLDSRNADRDAHLRGPDFFDVEKYPEITFRSTRAARGKHDDEYVLRGDLTIRDVTREVELTITYTGSSIDLSGGRRVGFEGETTVSRKDWGLSWNVVLEAGGFLVGDKVKLTLDVAAVRRAGQ